MNSKNLVRTLVAVVTLSTLGSMAVLPAFAQDKTPAKKAVTKTKTASAKLWECQHCKEPMSYAAAKEKNFKCCGMKMVAVKTTKKSEKKKG